MNIALCTDENFSIPALACITSILENNKEEELHIYVLTDGLFQNTQEKFKKLAKIYNQPVDIMAINKHRFNGLTVSDRFPISMYYRFLLPEMLYDEDHVLYLDCDIIVRHSLHELFLTDLSNLALAAVVGQSCDNLYWTNLLKLSTPYFNSGVLLMNLNYWRENQIADKLIHWLHHNPDKCNLPDQNALNKILEGKVKYLDYTYNFQERWFGKLTHNIHYNKWDEIKRVSVDPCIIHYCEGEKPWFIECTNPFHKDFIHYATLHNFIGFSLQKRYGVSYQCAKIVERMGLKLQYWADKWKKRIIARIKVS